MHYLADINGQAEEFSLLILNIKSINLLATLPNVSAFI